MGTVCPECKTHQPIVRNLTKDQKPAFKGTDVIGHELKCGHLVGGEKFNEFQKKRQKLEQIRAERIMQLDREYMDEMAALWTQISAIKDKGAK